MENTLNILDAIRSPRSYLDLFRLVAKSADWDRPRVEWPVMVGNGQQVMNFDQELAMKAKVGDTIEVAEDRKLIGHVKRIAVTGWLQWQFIPLQGD